MTNFDYNFLNDKKILVVEDDEASYIYISEIFCETTMEILHARLGEEAIEMCKTNGNIDLVLMDIQLPGINGFETTKILKNLYPHIPVIAQTAYALANDKHKCFESGCDDYISKPVKTETLVEKVISWLK